MFNLLARILAIPMGIIMLIFSMFMAIYQLVFNKKNNRQKGETGLVMFTQTDTAYFRQWFNRTHKLLDKENHESKLKLIFELIVYQAANFKSIMSHSELFEGIQKSIYLSKDESALRNNYATFEITCYFLSHLDKFLDNPVFMLKDEIMESMIDKLTILSADCFTVKTDEMKEIIQDRIWFYNEPENGTTDEPHEYISGFILKDMEHKFVITDYNFHSINSIMREGFSDMPQQIKDHLQQRIPSLERVWGELMPNDPFHEFKAG